MATGDGAAIFSAISVLASEEASQHWMHLHHLLATYRFVELDHDTHRQQHTGTAGITHRPDEVGYEFGRAAALAQEVGYSAVLRLSDGRPRALA